MKNKEYFSPEKTIDDINFFKWQKTDDVWHFGILYMYLLTKQFPDKKLLAQKKFPYSNELLNFILGGSMIRRVFRYDSRERPSFEEICQFLIELFRFAIKPDFQMFVDLDWIPKQLINNNELTTLDQFKRTKLHVSLDTGNFFKCFYCLRNGVNINSQDEIGRTPLMIVVTKGYLLFVEMFLIWGADLNLRNKRNETALFLAAMKGYTEIVQLLLQNSAEINVKSENMTALTVAIIQGHFEIVRCLFDHILKKDILVEYWTEEEVLSNLSATVQFNRVDILDFLVYNLQKHFSKNSFVQIISELIFKTCGKGNWELFSLLISFYPQLINNKNLNGDTCLHIIASFGHVELCKLLLNNKEIKVDLTLRNENGDTILMIACSYGFDIIVEDIIESFEIQKNKDMVTFLNIQNKQGNAAIHEACKFGCYKIVKLLIEKGANFLLKNNDRIKPVFIANSKNHMDIVELLQKQYCDIEFDNSCSIGLFKAIEDVQLKEIKEILMKDEYSSINILNSSGETGLHVACRYNSSKIVEILLSLGADINFQSLPEQKSCLHYVCMNNNVEIASFLLNNPDINVNLCDSVGNTCLHDACANNAIKIVRLLLNHEMTFLNATNFKGETPLFAAIQNESYEIVSLLLKHDAGINYMNDCGLSPLHLAILQNNYKLVKILLEFSAAIDLKMENVVCPLHLAIKNKNNKIVKCLLDFGADVNSICEVSNLTPLQLACKLELSTVVQLLLMYGADMYFSSHKTVLSCLEICKETNNVKMLDLLNNAEKIRFEMHSKYCVPLVSSICASSENFDFVLDLDLGLDFDNYPNSEDSHLKVKKCVEDLDLNFLNEINTSKLMNEQKHKNLLHYYVRIGDLSAVLRLIKHNLLVSSNISDDGSHSKEVLNEVDEYGRTPLWYSCCEGFEQITRILIHEGASISDSMLYVACQNGHIHIVDILLAYSREFINLSYQNRHGASFLYIACQEGHLDIVNLLLDKKVDVNLSRNDNTTPLYIACYLGRVKIVQALLEAKADVNIKSSKGFSPLHVACFYGHKETVKLLLSAEDIMVNIPNFKGETPLHVAVKKKFSDIAFHLIIHNADVLLKNKSGLSALDIAKNKIKDPDILQIFLNHAQQQKSR
eukprot:TRINITY_DN3231_c0_g1_i1.p1 TRINITY_DN3231_c0_g1~~TRINITY_DN3231_c0_g1_i1.p1  ORF type:complete len:1122 (+),score=264.18 TRINITY_DN3231_c0_g1_i1:2-3367(+)